MTRLFLRKKPASRWAKVALGLGGSLAVLGAVHAQTPAAPTGETTAPERIIVTGSQIPTAEEVGSAPVTTVDQAAIGRAGTDDPQVVLQKSEPAFTGGGNLGTSNASINSNSTQGGSVVSIHGLTTLVLLNGYRLADSAAIAAGGNAFQDVNLFPSSLIKRIEVLKDGASAIYGSDAVGGVVNVLLNDDFQGLAIDGRYGFAEKGDIHDQRYSGVFGFGDDKTRIVVGAQYEEQDPVLFSQRDFTKFFHDPNAGFTGYDTSNIGGKLNVGGTQYYLNTGLAAYPGTSSTVITPGTVLPVNSPTGLYTPGTITPVTGVTAGGVTVTGYPSTTNVGGAYKTSSNIGELGSLVGITLDQNRTNAYFDGERDIFGKQLTFFTNFLYSKNYSQSLLAPQPVSTNNSLNPEQDMVIPFGAPYNPFNETINAQAGFAPSTVTLPDGTTAKIGGVVVTNRFLDAVRTFRNDTDFYRVVAGFKGQVFTDYNYEVAFNHSVDQINYTNEGLINSQALVEALAGGYDAAGTAVPATFTTNAAGQTIVATPAGPYSRVNGVILPALDAFAVNNPTSTEAAVAGTDIRNQLSTLTTVDAKFTGFPVNLPGGPLGFAIGGEYRRESLKLVDSEENFVDSVPAANVEVSRDIGAGFLEVAIPVVNPTMKIPGVYSFDLDGAVRYEKYVGTNSAITPKASFVYRPIQDVAVRGTFSASFNAPTLFETNGPTTQGFTGAVSLGAGFTEQANSITTTNPSLGPTRTDTYSTGIVLSPHQVPGLTLSADFFHAEEHNLITSSPSDPTDILLDVNAAGPAAPAAYLAAVHYGSPTGPTGLFTGSAGKYLAGVAADYFVDTGLINGTNFRESLIDVGVNYDHDFGKFGGVTLGLNMTYYLQAKGNETPGGKNFDQIGLYLGADNAYTPDYKIAPYVEYRYGGASISFLGQYIPTLRNAAFIDPVDRAGDYTDYEHFNLPKIRDYFTVDSTISYEFGLKKPEPTAPMPAPKDGKDGGKSVVTSKDTAKKMMAINLLDGLKLTFGVNNITNARPSQVLLSPDSTNTDASIYDPFQRYYYFVVSKKF